MRYFYFLCLTVSTTTLLTACHHPPSDDVAEMKASEVSEFVHIKGQASYPQRIALRPGHQFAVSLEEVSMADRRSTVLAEMSRRPTGEQVPLAFELDVPRAKLKPRGRYAVRATLRDPSGNLRWTTDTAHLIDPSKMNQDLGILGLVQVSVSPAGGPAAENTTSQTVEYTCGTKALTARFGDENVTIDTGAATYTLSRAPSASGAKYERIDQRGRAVFWTKGETARFEWNGEAWPECRSESMTDTGDNEMKLAGTNWQVEDIAGGGIIDSSNVTLAFGEDGRISGSAGCNSFTGSYQLDGVKLALGPLAMTRKACVPALMNQEQKFLSILNEAASVAQGDHGALIVRSSDGRTVRAMPKQ